MERLKQFLGICILLASVAPWFADLSVAQTRSSESSSTKADSSIHPYNVNFWVSSSIVVAGTAAGILTIPARGKTRIDSAELVTAQTVNRNNIPSFDRWSLHQDPSIVDMYEGQSQVMQIAMGAAPLALLLDKGIWKDGWNIMLMGLEVNAVAVGIYTVSPLGPLFQSRYRPLVYYSKESLSGQWRNSFYSGHVASAAAASFFMAKVYTDYHPELGNDKYWFFAAAAIPPLYMGYIRLKALDHFPSDVAVGLTVGTAIGILVPELHRIGGKDVSMGVYSAPGATGLTLRWTPEVAQR